MKKNYIQPDFELLSITLSSDFLNTSGWENKDTDPNDYDSNEWT